MTVSSEDIMENPDAILADSEKLKEVVSNPDLVVDLLDVKDEPEMDVEVDGETVALAKPLFNPERVMMDKIFL
jgi:hypothetical protein